MVEDFALFGLADLVLVEPVGAFGVEDAAVGVGSQAREGEEDGRELRPGFGEGVFLAAVEGLQDLVEGAIASPLAVCLLLALDAVMDPLSFERRQPAEESGATADDAAEFFARASR